MSDSRRSTEMAQAIQMATIALEQGNATGPLVASVNGVPLFDGQVRKYFELFRGERFITGEEGLGAWAEKTGATFESMMMETVEYLVNFMLMQQIIEEMGIEVGEDEIDAQIGIAFEKIGVVDVHARLAELGFSMGQYRQGIRRYLERERLIGEAVSVDPPTDLETLAFMHHHGMAPKRAVLSEVDAQELEAARAACVVERTREAFDRWYGGQRRRADIVIGGLPADVLACMLGRP